jgi:hypothetical protein
MENFLFTITTVIYMIIFSTNQIYFSYRHKYIISQNARKTTRQDLVVPSRFLAVIGAEIAGVAGAIIGGTVGNAITDGIAGLFEGHMAERLREEKVSEKRTMIGSSIGKMAGCLLGAGFVLIIANLIDPRL